MTTKPASRLGARFRVGDDVAVSELYHLVHDKLLTIGRQRLGDPGLAEDAVQLAFVRAWRSAASYDPTRPLAPWLYTIMRRVCIDVYRSDRRGREVSTDDRFLDRVAEPPAGVA